MKEIVSFGNYSRFFMICKDGEKFVVRTTKEDEGTKEKEETRDEIIWLMTFYDFNPSKKEILNIQDAGLLDDWILAVRQNEKGGN